MGTASQKEPRVRTRILYVGEAWNGSSARSLREQLVKLPGVKLDGLREDHSLSRHRIKLIRGIRRVLDPLYRQALKRRIQSQCVVSCPDVLMVYKGASVGPDLVDWAKARGIFTVDVFPDCSPHAHGKRLREAMGRYDLVVSTKPLHPPAWFSIYGYRNRCVCVPHGYDPTLHYWQDPPGSQDIDVVLAANWRPEYEELVLGLAPILDELGVSVAVAGLRWAERRGRFPGHWQFPGALWGREYGEFVRSGKIVIAPVNRRLLVDGITQPGDEDTTRTYELAAAGCFFLHCRTPYVQGVYDESTEVPMWNDPAELGGLIARYLPLEIVRREMAARAHARAVPSYSIAARAAEVLDAVEAAMTSQASASGVEGSADIRSTDEAASYCLSSGPDA